MSQLLDGAKYQVKRIGIIQHKNQIIVEKAPMV